MVYVVKVLVEVLVVEIVVVDMSPMLSLMPPTVVVVESMDGMGSQYTSFNVHHMLLITIVIE